MSSDLRRRKIISQGLDKKVKKKYLKIFSSPPVERNDPVPEYPLFVRAELAHQHVVLGGEADHVVDLDSLRKVTGSEMKKKRKKDESFSLFLEGSVGIILVVVGGGGVAAAVVYLSCFCCDSGAVQAVLCLLLVTFLLLLVLLLQQ